MPLINLGSWVDKSCNTVVNPDPSYSPLRLRATMDTVPSKATLPVITASEVIPRIPTDDEPPLAGRRSPTREVTAPEASGPGAAINAEGPGCLGAELAQVVKISPMSWAPALIAA